MKKYLDLPIFSLVCLENSVLVSCGGGGKRVGLENCLILYPKPTYGLLKDPIHTLPLGEEIFEKMRLNHKTKMIVCNSENMCVILQVIDNQITELSKFVSDFATKEAYQNDASLNSNGDTIATGGEDGFMRLWEVRQRENQVSTKKLGQINLDSKIMSIDFHVSKQLVIAACENYECKIINYKTLKVVQLIQIDHGKLNFHSAYFSLDENHIFTFTNPMRGNSYMTQWKMEQQQEQIKPIKTIKIHNSPVVTTAQSKEGMFMAVGCSDGYAKIINTRYLDIEAKGQAHEMPIKALSFTPDSRFVVSGSVDYTYHFLANTRPEGWFSKITKLWFLGLVIAYLCTFIIDQFN